ncbi:unnamed protein product [Periconia digitata]|uniref:Uncharacterized protein n=1 Tax=Periconia digitata TaxID=1303443 RepID=A0A9W4UB65_9PLEO|nr:unnamed protein product [Periconia digitata]
MHARTHAWPFFRKAHGDGTLFVLAYLDQVSRGGESNRLLRFRNTFFSLFFPRQQNLSSYIKPSLAKLPIV